MKPKVWQELCKDTDNVVRVVRVEDHGQVRSTRKYKKKMLLMLPEILPMIIPQEVETLPRLFERSKIVETIPLPARTNLFEENKQEDKPEAAIAKSRRRSIPYMKVHALLKMTSPAKVKTTSPRRRTNSSKESPSSPSLKRLKPLKLANIAPRTNPNR